MRTILAVSPHPDDAEIGAGGTIAKWISEGADAYLAVCTNGNKGSSEEDITSDRLSGMREAEQLEAAKSLGIREVFFLGHQDGGLEDTNEFRGEIVRLIRKTKPQTVMTTDIYRRYLQHRDHRVTGQAVMDAVFPCARGHLFYPEHKAQGLETHGVQQIFFWGSMEPNTFIDIRETFEEKVAALRCHKSQLPGLFTGDTERRLRERAVEVGRERGIPLAEAFHRLDVPTSQWVGDTYMLR